MLIFTVVFSWIVRIPTGDIPYPLFAYTALLPWTFFSSSITFGVSSLVSNINLVTKVSMPREVLPIAAVLAGLFDFAIAALLLMLLLLVYRVVLHWSLIWIIPLLVIQLLLTLGLVLLGSALNVLYRDIRFVVPLAMQLWMYATPIIYPIDVVPEGLRWLYYLNPMATVIDGYRKAILEGLPPDGLAVGLASFISIVVLFAAYMVFKRLEPSYADVI
jgi:lipopolysaccharide transport system permease protein